MYVLLIAHYCRGFRSFDDRINERSDASPRLLRRQNDVGVMSRTRAAALCLSLSIVISRRSSTLKIKPITGQMLKRQY